MEWEWEQGNALRPNLLGKEDWGPPWMEFKEEAEGFVTVKRERTEQW